MDKFEAIRQREKAKKEAKDRKAAAARREEEEKQAIIDGRKARARAAAEKRAAGFPKSPVSGSNRSSTTAAMKTLSAQLRVVNLSNEVEAYC